MNERDTHFQGFADLLYPELTRLFYLLYTHRIANEHDIADQVQHQIKERLAQRGYDLAKHSFESVGDDKLTTDYYDGFDSGRLTVIQDIPDLTAWPEEE